MLPPEEFTTLPLIERVKLFRSIGMLVNKDNLVWGETMDTVISKLEENEKNRGLAESYSRLIDELAMEKASKRKALIALQLFLDLFPCNCATIEGTAGPKVAEAVRTGRAIFGIEL